MTLRDVVDSLGLQVVAGGDDLEREVTGGYASDLLSDVMARGRQGAVWITLQTHSNIIAVAALKELAGIVVVNGRTPPDETIARAQQEGTPLFTTPLTAFEAAGRLYQMGLRGYADAANV
jgi:hypothetical protein